MCRHLGQRTILLCSLKVNCPLQWTQTGRLALIGMNGHGSRPFVDEGEVSGCSACVLVYE